MCNIASGILVNGKVLESKHDSHEEIIKEHRLDDTTAEPKFVRFEIIPPDGKDYTAPLAEWQYRVDQDYLPDWYDADKAEAAARQWLAEYWYPTHVVDGVLTLHSGQAHLYGNSTAKLYGDSTADLYDNSNVESVSQMAVAIDMRGDYPVCKTRKDFE